MYRNQGYPYHAQEVAAYIITCYREKNMPLTHVKMQKILYMISVKWLKKHKTRLFPQTIEKWKMGPVVPCVYCEYMEFGLNNIEYPATVITLDKNNTILRSVPSPPEWTYSQKQLVNSVLHETELKTAEELIELTHNHEAWYKDAKKINCGGKGIAYTDEELLYET